MEAFGKVHPRQRHYYQWDQMTEKERRLHRNEIADIWLAVAERFGHSAIFVRPNPGHPEAEVFRMLDLLREKSGDRYCLLLGGDCTYGIPSGSKMMEFTSRLADEPEKMKAEARDNVNRSLDMAERCARHGGLDGYVLTVDYCFNTGPFLSPGMFSEFVTPYLSDLIKGYRDRGFYTIKHCDGNIMPILDQLVQARPDALHSIDPQAGVDIAEVKRLAGDRVCLVGNVNCGLLQTGTDQEVIDSARYALRSGMPGYGYIFATSNVVYTGMRLDRYELMLSVWRTEGNYPEPEARNA